MEILIELFREIINELLILSISFVMLIIIFRNDDKEWF